MEFDRNIVASAARRFLISRHPIVLLSVPGCGPTAISPAHWRSKDLRFVGARCLLVQSEAEFMALVSWIATGSVPRGVVLSAQLRQAIESATCYCGKVLSILSLRKKDCVHEAHYGGFLDYGGVLVSLPGWEFNLTAAPLVKRSRRVYRVLRTHSRLLAEGASPVFPAVTGLMEVRFISSQNLYLVVDGIPEQDRLTARVELRGSSRPALAVLPEFTREISRTDLPVYRILDEHLEQAYREPDRALEILQAAAAFLADGSEPNYPVIDIISSLMERPAETRPVSAGLLKKRIADIRARLWDAPVVAGYVRSQLDGRLASREFTTRLQSFPLDVQADLAALSMSLPKIEAGDHYLYHVA